MWRRYLYSINADACSEDDISMVDGVINMLRVEQAHEVSINPSHFIDRNAILKEPHTQTNSIIIFSPSCNTKHL